MKLKNPKHEAFAQAVADGLAGVQAYRENVSDKATLDSAMVLASRLLSDVQIGLRVAELRKKADDILNKKLGVTKETVLRWHVTVLFAKGKDVDTNSNLCQGYTRTKRVDDAGAEWETEKVTLPSKMDAARALADLCGWNADKKISAELTGDALLASIAEAMASGASKATP